ncbi:MAG: hypothetical protein HQL73_02110 [Magnetococcales bacterium]|nr:hypothetical protein [Magnetococcales bacterium]
MSDTPISHVFFVTSHGTAGDHLFNWFGKALNAHPEILVYLGESVRQKYFKERSRKERPDPILFTRFLADLGTSYQAVGDCYSYRAYQLELLREAFQNQVRFVNIVRHPYTWLYFYVGWRCSNMRMPPGETGPLDHEWTITRHDEFAQLGLKPYTKGDVSVWASYQGMHILNRMISDQRIGKLNFRLEQVAQDRDCFQGIIDYLTFNRVRFDSALLDLIYGWVHVPFRGSSEVRFDSDTEYASWPDWKREAFSRIVSQEACDMFRQFGYSL